MNPFADRGSAERHTGKHGLSVSEGWRWLLPVESRAQWDALVREAESPKATLRAGAAAAAAPVYAFLVAAERSFTQRHQEWLTYGRRELEGRPGVTRVEADGVGPLGIFVAMVPVGMVVATAYRDREGVVPELGATWVEVTQDRLDRLDWSLQKLQRRAEFWGPLLDNRQSADFYRLRTELIAAATTRLRRLGTDRSVPPAAPGTIREHALHLLFGDNDEARGLVKTAETAG